VRWAEIDGDVRWERIDRSVFCGAPGATTACGSGIDPRLSISKDCAAEKRSGTKNVSFAPFLSRKEKEMNKKKKLSQSPSK